MKSGHTEWLERAEDDLNFARVGLKEGFYSQVCYLSHQVIEKSLKACLVAEERNYPKNHSLIELTRLTPKLPLKPLKEKIAVIDGYYIPTRYPDAAPGMKESGPPTKEEAQEALQTAEEVFGMVSKSAF